MTEPVADGGAGVDEAPGGAVTSEGEGQPGGFVVHLDAYEGPFDLLLQLIAKHKLDITEIALSKVTVEFIAHLKAMGPEGDLEQTTEFLLVASTLLDLKAARLLPQTDVEDEEDLALLEARDLLFARLLQYRAFKQVAARMQERLADESRRYPRSVALEPRFATLLPEVLISVGPEELAVLAAKAMQPKAPPVLSLTHLHAPQVSVRDQAVVVVERLRRGTSITFRTLVADAPDTLTKVARFLALLELFRESVVAFDQVTPLGELTIRWTGTEEGDVEVSAEFDEDQIAVPEETESDDERQ
ncbi:segregation and condensation protein A [Mumia sp. DW29H23]|uniref:segregation and condensation protein A n=1 Tax=Mumia sp. DW29H23 TaxID=3421241 RepID=UPI003D68F1A5